MLRACATVLLLGLAGCAGGLANGLFQKPGVSYRVATPDPKTWQPVAFSDNDLAWAARGSGHVLAMNAVCEGHGDAPLDVLTRHLLFGFSDRERLTAETEPLDGREALRSTWSARLDGVPVELELVVLKKNGCVHDFVYVSPVGRRGQNQAAFDALVQQFRQEGRG